MNTFRHNVAGACLFAAATLFASHSVPLAAQTANSATTFVRSKGVLSARITEKIDDSRRTTLSGHVRPFLKRAADHGAVADSMQTHPIMMMFTRTAQQQADLDALVDELHNKNSAQYHQWLTPAQFGAKFGAADADVATVRTWLEGKGFQVLDVVPSKTFISFTGTVGQLKSAFGVNIHHVTMRGEEHVATMNDPQIPVALQPLVGGLHKLDDFSGHPLLKQLGAFTKNAKTGRMVPVTAAGTPKAAFTDGGGNFQVAPQDFYTIYNENPLLKAGITGAGQTIALIEDTQVVPADVNSFRSVFGLPAYPSTPNASQGGVNYLYGNNTSGLGGYGSCYAPATTAAGKKSGDEGEADLDLQWAGTVAPNATIDFVACGGTAKSSSGTTFGALGIDHAAQYIANYLSGTVTAASMSYGECEADMTASTVSGVGYYNNQWQQFAAEGITPIISSGDGGAEQCYQNDAYGTTLPPSVNGFGSSAYNVAAGGTDFGDLYESNGYSTTPSTAWWSNTNTSALGSALTYVPETTWSGYCSNPLFVSYLQANNSTTFGSVYTPEALCSNPAAKADGYLAVVGGAGGVSTFNTIPAWQSVYGIGKNSVSSTYRNLPDVSLFAANGFWGHFLPFCESDENACTTSYYETNGEVLGAGGTSFVAPQLAGFMALVNQKTGQRQGQANYTFYNLAAQEYGTTSTAARGLSQCSGSAVTPGQAPPSSCLFYDVSNDMPSLQGGTITPGIYQPCVAGGVDCYSGNGGSTYGVNIVPGTAVSAGILGYTASPGYDDATGLGSLNISGIVEAWTTPTPTYTTTTTLSANSTTISPTESVTLTADVTSSRGGTVAPAGTVTFYVNSTSGLNLGSGSLSQSCSGSSCQGAASLTVAASALPSNSNTIIAYYGGDATGDSPSTSAPITVTIKTASAPFGLLEQAVGAATDNTLIATNDNVYVSGWAADAVDGAPLKNIQVYIDGVAVGTPYLGDARPAVASSYNNPAYLYSGYHFYYPASLLAAGSHSVTVIATDSAGLATSFGPKLITIQNTYPAPVGNLDSATDQNTHSTTVNQGDNLAVSGWAGDPTDGTPLVILHVLIDGNEVGSATQGLPRPDVVAATGNAAYANSGYSFLYPTASLSPGVHQVNVVALNSHLVSKDYGPLFFTVQAAQ